MLEKRRRHRAALEDEAVNAATSEWFTARVIQRRGGPDRVPLYSQPDTNSLRIGERKVGDVLRITNQLNGFALLHPLELARVARDYQDYWSSVLKNEVPRLNDNAWISTASLAEVKAGEPVDGFGTADSDDEPPDLDDAVEVQLQELEPGAALRSRDALQLVGQALTIIVSTSAAEHHCRPEVVLRVLNSLQENKALCLCRTLLVFDALPDDADRAAAGETVSKDGTRWVPQTNPALVEAYEKYKKDIEQAKQSKHPCLNRVELLFMPKWGHLVGTVRYALEHVATPFVLLHQHDLLLNRNFTSTLAVAVLRALAERKANYVILNRDVNFVSRSTQYFQAAPHRLDMWRSFVRGHSQQLDDEDHTPLTPFIGYSDQSHLARADWVRDRVLPMVGDRKCCMEFAVYEVMLLAWLHDPRRWEHTFMLGGMLDGPYIYDMPKNGHIWADEDEAYSDEKTEEMYVSEDERIRHPERPRECLALYSSQLSMSWWYQAARRPESESNPLVITLFPDPHADENRCCFQDFNLKSDRLEKQARGLFQPMRPLD